MRRRWKRSSRHRRRPSRQQHASAPEWGRQRLARQHPQWRSNQRLLHLLQARRTSTYTDTDDTTAETKCHKVCRQPDCYLASGYINDAKWSVTKNDTSNQEKQPASSRMTGSSGRGKRGGEICMRGSIGTGGSSECCSSCRIPADTREVRGTHGEQCGVTIFDKWQAWIPWSSRQVAVDRTCQEVFTQKWAIYIQRFEDRGNRCVFHQSGKRLGGRSGGGYGNRHTSITRIRNHAGGDECGGDGSVPQGAGDDRAVSSMHQRRGGEGRDWHDSIHNGGRTNFCFTSYKLAAPAAAADRHRQISELHRSTLQTQGGEQRQEAGSSTCGAAISRTSGGISQEQVSGLRCIDGGSEGDQSSSEGSQNGNIIRCQYDVCESSMFEPRAAEEVRTAEPSLIPPLQKQEPSGLTTLYARRLMGKGAMHGGGMMAHGLLRGPHTPLGVAEKGWRTA